MKREELYFLSVVAISVFLAAECLFAQAEEVWLPKGHHIAALERGTDCSILRSLEFEARSRVRETVKVLEDQREDLKTRRRQLESCAKEKGIARNYDESQIAEACPIAYRDWVSPGYRYRMLTEDLNEARTTLVEAQSHLNYRCQTAVKILISTNHENP